LSPERSEFVIPSVAIEREAFIGVVEGPHKEYALILTPMVIADTPCGIPDKDVTVAKEVTPAYPDSAKDLGLGFVVVLVDVTVEPDGSVERAIITQSSHNMAIDVAALKAARQSTYSPKIVGCQAITSTFIFRARMAPRTAPR
jgi:TonB family protein